MPKPKAEATESTPEAGETEVVTCAYCGASIADDYGVVASDAGKTITCCSWRHLHWKLVDIFTTGKHVGMDMK